MKVKVRLLWLTGPDYGYGERPLLVRLSEKTEQVVKLPKLASKLLEEEREKEKKQKAAANKREKTKRENKEKKELEKLKELQAKYGKL